MTQLKKWNILIYALIFFAISLGGKTVHFITDYYWFQELALTNIFEKIFLTKLILAISSAVFVGVILWANLIIAQKFSCKPFVVIEPDATIDAPLPIPQLAELKPIFNFLLYIFIFMVAFFVGNWASRHWETLLKFMDGAPFQIQDPLFNLDIGFYVFKLPFYRFLYRIVLLSLSLSLLIAILSYLLNSKIYLKEDGIKIADSSKFHLLILLGLICALLSFYFQFKMFDLLYSQRALAPGAGYADIKAYLPGLKILRFVALISGIVFLISPWIASTRILFGTMVVLAGGILLARIYAETIQKFEVAPNEIKKETPYLTLAIENTRKAYGLTDIQELEFDPKENLTLELLKKNSPTIQNVRLWEHRPLLTSYAQLQEIRTYYDFLDADNDRYLINGEYRQIMLSARELVPESLPSRIWINEHLAFTHGYGICLGPVNQISPEGLPEFFIKDIPPISTIDLQVTQPEIYFGEAQTNYAIVKTKTKEFNYPAGDENVYTIYEGNGGVQVRNFFRRLLFAIRFGELKILFSGDINSESKFIYHRSIRERISKAAPFIHFDADPYLVISEKGKLFWIIDGYTVTDQYPYSEKTSGINYIRNSVKTTIDAYNGGIAFYVADAQDPIIQTYSKIFSNVFKPIDEMPADLRSHIRYPQTLMNIQAKIYSTYHMTDPQVFYNKEDLWKIPIRTTGGRADQMEPYYTIMKLAGIGTREEFILMVPFTPAKKENMIAWMAARCDVPNYGKLFVYNFPKQKLVYGPQQIESRIDQEAEISKQLTLWDQGGSRVLRGSLLVIPVEQSLLYIQPLYLEASGGGLPELKRVIVAYGNLIAMEENLESSLAKIFGSRFEKATQSSAPSQDKTTKNFQSLIRKAKEHFDKAQRAVRQGNWAEYGEEMKTLEHTLQDLTHNQ